MRASATNPAMNATSTATACPPDTNGPPKEPGPLEAIVSGEAPSAIAIE